MVNNKEYGLSKQYIFSDMDSIPIFSILVELAYWFLMCSSVMNTVFLSRVFVSVLLVIMRRLVFHWVWTVKTFPFNSLKNKIPSLRFYFIIHVKLTFLNHMYVSFIVTHTCTLGGRDVCTETSANMVADINGALWITSPATLSTKGTLWTRITISTVVPIPACCNIPWKYVF